MLTVVIASLCSYAQQPEIKGQWSVEKANEWYAKQAWIAGCNFLPSTAVNDVEMWQDETFDLPTIDRELAIAKKAGINSVRVFLNYVVWEAEAKKFKSNFKKFLNVAEKYGISVMPILFDDCNFSGNVAKVGKQKDPVPGIHNSGWVSSPPAEMVRDETQWDKLKKYEQDMIKTFRHDKRIIIWDLYNEPANSGSKLRPELLEKIFVWARESKPSQPLTVGAHTNFDGELSLLMRQHSDIVSFHAYDKKEDVEKRIRWAHKTGRPAVCTEWLRRQVGNTPEIILPLFKENKVGGYNWGLVAGRTQTYFHWGSRKDAPEPTIWQHDLFRRDLTPYSEDEIELIKELSGKTVDK
ncbi:MAG: cellulase family glycosylhydrolase [Prevotellaceae bacterium]|nr:cellulase family glycosylhydrolase [Prevotellaceae bacterium]